MKRRQFLIGAGGVGCVVLGAGAWLSSHDIEAAQAPWQTDSQAFDDPRLQALSLAVLAPNPHNQQPWNIELVGTDTILLHPDTQRFLPETDPPNRQITIGYGAFVELLAQAASASGFALDITPFPQGSNPDKLDERPIASVRLLQSDAAADRLFQTIRHRRTNRRPFDVERPVPENDLQRLANAISSSDQLGWTSDPPRVASITTINKEAWSIEMNTPGPHSESTRLTRIGADEVNAQPDGISLHGALIEGASLSGAFTHENLAKPGSFAFDQTAQFYAGLIDATPTYAWLITETNDRETQLNAGRSWARLNQTATALGVAFHPISQALQEFPEMREQFLAIHQALEVEPPARVQGLFRLGYADAPAPAPRWPLDKKIIQDG